MGGVLRPGDILAIEGIPPRVVVSFPHAFKIPATAVTLSERWSVSTSTVTSVHEFGWWERQSIKLNAEEAAWCPGT